MKEEIKINPRGSVGDISYGVMSTYKKPLHYEQIADILDRVGYYKVRRKSQPMDFTALRRTISRDRRFVKLGNGYIGLKEWDFEPNEPVEPEANCSEAVSEELEVPIDETKRNTEIENTRELSDANMVPDNSIECENKIMNSEESISHENVLPNEVVNIFKRYYNKDEIEELEERARKDYYDRFLPQFISDEMNRIGERNKV